MERTTLTNEQLIDRIKAGDERRTEYLLQLWNQNQGIIRKYVSKYSGSVEYDDLIQEAFIALCIAIRYYQPEKGKFTTYLGIKLIEGLYRYCRQYSTLLKIPPNKQDMMSRVRKAADDYEQKFFHEPSKKELADYFGFTQSEIDQAYAADLARSTVSIYIPIGSSEEEALALADTIDSGETFENDVIEQEFQSALKAAVHEELNELPEEQRRAIILVYLNGLSRREAGQIMGLASYQVQSRIDMGFKTIRIKAPEKLKLFIQDKEVWDAIERQRESAANVFPWEKSK